ncbi:hypothetical protein LVDJXP189_1130015 [Flavobacterium psychrophilum]|nr:hypothetical protein FI146_840119 [Flavobacterium psychrophilum]SNB00852.1 hypothetical protein FPC831_1380012 [Flavobacterium psychrophilum]SNB07449.1 hypothetical protein KU06112801_160012 [Flavobacterium psychrophilum]SNB18483.1 hypothetical protein KU05112810_770004 [Flavobacterium psychrophilum]SNB35858.1 hypothetical protein NO098_250009 [Flavobacterium psychrophilum]
MFDCSNTLKCGLKFYFKFYFFAQHPAFLSFVQDFISSLVHVFLSL